MKIDDELNNQRLIKVIDSTVGQIISDFLVTFMYEIVRFIKI